MVKITYCGGGAGVEAVPWADTSPIIIDDVIIITTSIIVVILILSNEAEI